jgi:hypothetical protein
MKTPIENLLAHFGTNRDLNLDIDAVSSVVYAYTRWYDDLDEDHKPVVSSMIQELKEDGYIEETRPNAWKVTEEGFSQYLANRHP